MEKNKETDAPKEVIDYLEEHGVTLEDLRWMAQYHKTVTKYGDWIAKAIVTSTMMAILTGVGYLLVTGVKAMFAQLK